MMENSTASGKTPTEKVVNPTKTVTSGNTTMLPMDHMFPEPTTTSSKRLTNSELPLPPTDLLMDQTGKLKTHGLMIMDTLLSEPTLPPEHGLTPTLLMELTTSLLTCLLVMLLSLQRPASPSTKPPVSLTSLLMDSNHGCWLTSMKTRMPLKWKP